MVKEMEANPKRPTRGLALQVAETLLQDMRICLELGVVAAMALSHPLLHPCLPGAPAISIGVHSYQQ